MQDGTGAGKIRQRGRVKGGEHMEITRTIQIQLTSVVDSKDVGEEGIRRRTRASGE